MDHHDELRLLSGACAASQTGAWYYRVGDDRVELNRSGSAGG